MHNGQQSRIWGARGERLNELEGLLAAVGFQVQRDRARVTLYGRRDEEHIII